MAEGEKKAEREVIQDIIANSEAEFEKKITYISAGALLLSLTLLEKIISLENSTYLGLIIAGWIILVLTLIINLVSHLIAKIFLRKSQLDIDNKIEYKIRKKNYKKSH